MADNGQHCRALLARSLAGQSCPNRVGQGAVFSLRSWTLDTRWTSGGPGAVTVTVDIIVFPL